MRHAQALGQKQIELVAEPLAPVAQVRALVREGVLEKLLAGEVLEIGVVDAIAGWVSPLSRSNSTPSEACPQKIMVLSDVRRCGVIILASCRLHERAAHRIKRNGRIRLQPTCPALARPVGLPLRRGRSRRSSDSPLSVFLLPLARACAVMPM